MYDSVNATTGTPTASTLTFTSTNPVASVSLAVGSPTGTFATSSSSEKAAFSISTNNYTGYTLTMTSTGSNTTLTDGSSHNISTISSTTTESVFSSSDASGQALNNRWGYIPNYYNASGTNPVENTTTYYPAPTSVNAATLRTTSSANSTNGIDNADNYTIGLGFRADYNSPSGTYANDTFILEFVANAIAYTITYDENVGSSGDTVTNMPATQSGDTSATNITLSNLVPVRNKYFFMGWCLGTVTNTNNYDTCNGTIYNPDGGGTDLSFGIDQTTSDNVTLYAMWDRVYTLTFKTATNATSVVFNGETYTNNQTKTIRASELTNPYHIYGNYATRYAFSSWTITAGTLGNSNYQNTTYTVTDDATITLTGQQVTTAMQNLAFSSCTTTATPVYDNRDDSVYWIQKLADGNCWMLDNMALDLTSSSVVNSLSATNTNLNATALTYFKNGGGTSSDRYPTAAYGTIDSSDSYSQPLTYSANKNKTLMAEGATPYEDSYGGAFGLGQGKIGAYYNYCAASVGYYCFGNGAGDSGTPPQYEENPFSVCPAGWRMAKARANSETQNLAIAITGNDLNEYSGDDVINIERAISASFAGRFYNGRLGGLGDLAYIWTSSYYNVGGMNRLATTSLLVKTKQGSERPMGSSVRCINPSYYTITFRTNNATGIVFNGVTYTDGQTLKIPKDEAAVNKYHIYGTYATRYAFSSWSTTAGTFENQNYQNTAFTVTDDTTITLTGQQVTTAMQNLSASNCTTTARPVYDNRDNTVYWIQKLPDNNCWMLDNLALDLTSSTIVNALSTTNTHLDATSLTYFKDGGGTSPDRYPITAYGTFGSTNSYSQPLTNMDSKNITLRPSTATNYTDSIAGAYGQGQGKIGAYYNYCAASVGYYCYGNGTSAGTSSGDNAYDICPAGWRMPTGASAGVYRSLCSAIKGSKCVSSGSESMSATSPTSLQTQLSTPLSGYFNSGSASNRGSGGYFWSSTRYSNGDVYYLYVNSSSVSPTRDYYRRSGASVRCVLPSHYTITFKTNNATGIVFNGVTYTDGQTLTVSVDEVAGKEYHIYGNYGTRYAFSSWSATAGTFSNQNYQNTTYTITGDATITLTGQQVTTAIQNLPLSSCTTTARPVYDNRDDSVYWIQKLPDNNCWMLDNLALDLTSSTIVNALSTTNTHLDATSLTYFKNGGGTTSDRYPTAAYGTFDSSDVYSQPRTNVESKDITLRPSTATNYTGSFAGAYGLGQGKIGAYYNYCAASVGYYCYGNGISAGTPSGDNAYDICPAGWRMPTGASAGVYRSLCSVIKGSECVSSGSESMSATSPTSLQTQLSTPLSGHFNSGSAINRGSDGSFWSSTRDNNYRMYYLYVNSSLVYPTSYFNRYVGFSVRCVLGS